MACSWARLARRCVDCGEGHAYPGSRCAGCERSFQARRNAQLKRAAYTDPLYRSIPLAGPCADCGSHVDLTRHHLRAVRDSGTVLDGILILCRSCNAKRG